MRPDVSNKDCSKYLSVEVTPTPRNNSVNMVSFVAVSSILPYENQLSDSVQANRVNSSLTVNIDTVILGFDF